MTRWFRFTPALLALVVVVAMFAGVPSSTAVQSASARCAAWAATSGDDDDPGTAAAPFRSFGRLVASLRAGETGCLPSGETYYAVSGNGIVSTTHGRAGAKVTVTSGPGGRAVVQGQLWLTPSSHDVRLQGLDFAGNYGPGGVPNGTKATHLILHGDRIEILDDDISDPRGICIGAGKAHATDASVDDRADDLVIARNRIHDCGMAPDLTWTKRDSGAHGIYLENTLEARVYDNLIYRNRYRGLQLWPRNDGARIHHNVFDENATQVNIGSSEACGSRCRVRVGFRSVNTKVYANIFSNRVADWWPSKNPSQVYGYFLDGSPAYGNEVWNNCFAPRDPAATGSGFAQHDNLTTRVRYVDRAARDYRLTATSPCQGRGPRVDVGW